MKVNAAAPSVTSAAPGQPVDLTYAAEKALPAVVHIKYVQTERIAYCNDPFANLDVVAVGNRKSREVFRVDFYQGKVCTFVCTNDACREFAVVVECYRQFVSSFYHVVVGDDISVAADDDTRACSLSLGSLRYT
jgi:hypothetical protein